MKKKPLDKYEINRRKRAAAAKLKEEAEIHHLIAMAIGTESHYRQHSWSTRTKLSKIASEYAKEAIELEDAAKEIDRTTQG